MINTLPDTPELRYVAERSVWFKPPVEALANPRHLIAYALTFGTPDCVSILRRFVSDAELIEVLKDAPPGVFDPRSWHYWHLMLGLYPPPPLPVRTFEAH